ncbi:NUDIX hydrolase [Euzebya sp.]|uniref:NUDIX hydrolase n=1 Tax=Euzebya sp. TaxID=1971409 RepID=UPI003512563D
MDHPTIGIGVIVLRDGRLLVVQRGRPPGRGLWAVPGGRLEVGETIAEGVVRELAEETGLVGTPRGLCGIAERIGPDHHIVIHDWWVDVEGDAEPVAGDDAVAVAFVSRPELLALPLVPLLEDFLREHGVWDLMRP